MQVTQDQVKLTAHGMWCDLLRTKLHEAFYPLRPLTKAKASDLHDHVLSIVLNHETTHLRVHVDKMIDKLKLASSEVDRLNEQYKSTNKLLFWKKARLERLIYAAIAIRETYKASVSILTNTPPELLKPDGVNHMTVNR